MLPKKFIFCHIPKVAGTLFGQILDRNFGKKFYPYYGLWDNRFFTKEDVAGMCDLHPQYECLASHMFSLDLPFDSTRFDFRAICFVRDPVERALSLYFYSHRMARLNPGYIPPTSPQDFFKSILNGGDDDRFQNAQYRFLCGGKPDSIAINNIKRLAENERLLIVPVKRLADCCLLLEKLYPMHFKNTAYGRRSNASKKSEDIPLEIIQIIQDKNHKDVELVEVAEKSFEACFSHQFPSLAACENLRKKFRVKCSRIGFIEKIMSVQRRFRKK
jgi:hypothetical protein